MISPIDVFLFFDDLGIFDRISRACWGNSMYCHCTINLFTASMNYWTDNEHCDHKQATKKKPYTNNRYLFQDKHVEIVCESMESFINTRQNKTYWRKDLARWLHGALACEQQTHFRASPLSLHRRERSDHRKYVCCSQATRSICVDCLVIGRQVSQYRLPLT